jgi:hypothetical protein
MRIALRQAAGPGNLFAGSALAGLIGSEVPVDVGSHRKAARVVEALAIEDGAAMLLTVEVPDDDDIARLRETLSPRLDRFSIGLNP